MKKIYSLMICLMAISSGSLMSMDDADGQSPASPAGSTTSAMRTHGSRLVQAGTTYDPEGSFKIRPTFVQVEQKLQDYATKQYIDRVVRTLREQQSRIAENSSDAMRQLVRDEISDCVTWPHLAQLLAERDMQRADLLAEHNEAWANLLAERDMEWAKKLAASDLKLQQQIAVLQVLTNGQVQCSQGLEKMSNSIQVLSGQLDALRARQAMQKDEERYPQLEASVALHDRRLNTLFTLQEALSKGQADIAGAVVALDKDLDKCIAQQKKSHPENAELEDLQKRELKNLAELMEAIQLNNLAELMKANHRQVAADKK